MQPLFFSFIMVCLMCTTANSQQAKTKKLTDAYAKAALRALKAIESDGSAPEERDGQIYGDRHTIDAINDADVEAKASQERYVTDSLRKLYTTKLVDNSKRQMKQMGYEIAESSDNDLLNKIKAKEKMAKDPELAEMTKREQACFGGLEDALRARSSAIPQACTSLK